MMRSILQLVFPQEQEVGGVPIRSQFVSRRSWLTSEPEKQLYPLLFKKDDPDHRLDLTPSLSTSTNRNFETGDTSQVKPPEKPQCSLA